MAAGKGTRMKELTANQPKHLIPVNGRPFITYLLDRLKEAGFDQFVLVIGYKADMFRGWIKSSGYDVTLVEQPMGEHDRYGTAVPPMLAKEATQGEPFVVVNGDNLYSVRDLKKFNRDDGFGYVGGLYSDHPEQFGVLVTRLDGTLEKIVEKPTTFVGNLINTNLLTCQPEFHDALAQIQVSPRGEYEITDAVTILAQRGKMKVIRLEDFWMDFGRPEDIAKLENALREPAKPVTV